MTGGSGDDGGVGHGFVEAFGPILNVIVVDGACLSWLSVLLLLRVLRHCEWVRVEDVFAGGLDGEAERRKE